MGAAAAGFIVGKGLEAWGTAKKASEAKKKRKELLEAQEKWLPDIGKYTGDWFSDMQKYTPEAIKLSDTISEAQYDQELRLREKALPGFGSATRGAMDAIAPLLKGELPPEVLAAFQRAGGASTVGAGMGGSGYGFLNTGIFGAKGALGAMQTGFGLLPALMSTLPNVQGSGVMSFLQAIMTPAQRTQAQLQIRGQNIGIQQSAAGMPTSGDIWGNYLQEMGGQIAGIASMGMRGGGGGLPMGGTGAGWNTPTTQGNPAGWQRLTG